MTDAQACPVCAAAVASNLPWSAKLCPVCGVTAESAGTQPEPTDEHYGPGPEPTDAYLLELVDNAPAASLPELRTGYGAGYRAGVASQAARVADLSAKSSDLKAIVARLVARVDASDSARDSALDRAKAVDLLIAERDAQIDLLKATIECRGGGCPRRQTITELEAALRMCVAELVKTEHPIHDDLHDDSTDRWCASCHMPNFAHHRPDCSRTEALAAGRKALGEKS